MSRDYARLSRVTKKYPHYKCNQPSSKRWFWLLSLIVIFGIGLGYLKHRHAKNASTLGVVQADKRTAKVSNYVAKKKLKARNETVDKENSSEPEFDFYTLLPKSKVTPDATTSSAGQFVLHVMTLNNQAVAEHWKTQLGLLGLEVAVIKAITSGGVKYRVMAGPYNSKRAAEADQAQLKANKINSSLEELGGAKD